MKILAVRLAALPMFAPAADSRVFEMRTYYAAPGKIDALNARFRDHTVKLFEKHGITNIGYWMPIENPGGRLIYLLAYPSRAAREASWKTFNADPAWTAALTESEKSGKLVVKADHLFLQATDFSPPVQPNSGKGERVFELRTYTTPPKLLGALDARFRDHTLKLFEKHGMANLFYFHLLPDAPSSEQTLIYFLAHQSAQAREDSFKAFRTDPDWIKAKTASEQKAGGSLTVPDGVKSVLLKATDYSPTR